MNKRKRKAFESKGYIDAENISAQKSDILNKKIGNSHATAYTLKNDPRTKKWDQITHEKNNISEKKLSGPRTRNKVDKSIMADMLKDANKGIKKQYLVTSDGDYTETVKELKNQGVDITVLGEKKTPKKLRKAASRFEIL